MSYLYLIATERKGQPWGPIKVGITGNLRSRLRMIQTGCAKPIFFYDAWDFTDSPDLARFLEGAFHKLQAKHRLVGEWFGMSPLHADQIIELYVRSGFRLSEAATEAEIEAVPHFGIVGRTIDQFGCFGSRA